MVVAEAATVAHLSLPLLYNPLVNGLEEARELEVSVGMTIIGRYKVVASSTCDVSNCPHGSWRTYACGDGYARPPSEPLLTSCSFA